MFVVSCDYTSSISIDPNSTYLLLAAPIAEQGQSVVPKEVEPTVIVGASAQPMKDRVGHVEQRNAAAPIETPVIPSVPVVKVPEPEVPVAPVVQESKVIATLEQRSEVVAPVVPAPVQPVQPVVVVPPQPAEDAKPCRACIESQITARNVVPVVVVPEVSY